MRTIWKYELELSDDIISLSIPSRGKILHVGSTNDMNPMLWFEVNSSQCLYVRHFRVFGTGQPQSIGLDTQYVGSVVVKSGTYVWHVYEVMMDS